VTSIATTYSPSRARVSGRTTGQANSISIIGTAACSDGMAATALA
jgi:hypothetical protein